MKPLPEDYKINNSSSIIENISITGKIEKALDIRVQDSEKISEKLNHINDLERAIDCCDINSTEKNYMGGLLEVTSNIKVLKKRFQRKALTIAVVGQARQGKSLLLSRDASKNYAL